MAAGLWLAVSGSNESVVTPCFGAGAALLIFWQWPTIRRARILGQEIERLEKQKEKAEERLDQILLPIATMLFELVARHGRMSPIPRRMQLALIDDIERKLRHLGASSLDIECAKQDWHRFNTIDMARPIVEQLRQQISAKVASIRTEISAIRQPIDSTNHQRFADLVRQKTNMEKGVEALEDIWALGDYRAIPSLLRRFDDDGLWLTAEERDAVLNEHREILLDLDEYVQSGTIRRREVWLGGEN